MDIHLNSHEDINIGTVPVWRKVCLTVKEAAEYTGVGIGRIRAITDKHEDMVVWAGSKRLIKRESLEKYIKSVFSV